MVLTRSGMRSTLIDAKKTSTPKISKVKKKFKETNLENKIDKKLENINPVQLDHLNEKKINEKKINKNILKSNLKDNINEEYFLESVDRSPIKPNSNMKSQGNQDIFLNNSKTPPAMSGEGKRKRKRQRQSKKHDLSFLFPSSPTLNINDGININNINMQSYLSSSPSIRKQRQLSSTCVKPNNGFLNVHNDDVKLISNIQEISPPLDIISEPDDSVDYTTYASSFSSPLIMPPSSPTSSRSLINLNLNYPSVRTPLSQIDMNRNYLSSCEDENTKINSKHLSSINKSIKKNIMKKNIQYTDKKFNTSKLHNQPSNKNIKSLTLDEKAIGITNSENDSSKLIEKFKEIDNWELAFETASSSFTD